MICPECSRPLEIVGRETITCVGCLARFDVFDGVAILTPAADSRQHAHQRRYFDAEFSAYEEYRVENWRASFMRRIFAALEIPRAGGRYLDVGVGGSGATVIEAARLGTLSTGCDLSVEGVLRARAFAVAEGMRETTDFVVCAAERLPFPDESFACASAVALLEHLDDDAEAVAELARVLEPGGMLWITVPHAYRYIPLPLWPVYWMHDGRIGHKRHYDIAKLSSVMRAAGLELVATEFSGHGIKVLQFALSACSRAMHRRDSTLWWRLEARDLRASARPRGAVQLNAVFRRIRAGAPTG